MIDPQHRCSWTGRRLTEIAVAGSGLRGAGVSLHVLLHAFADQELVWYSSVYGDHGDNVLFVAVDEATTASLEKLPSQRLAVSGSTPDSPDLVQFALSDGVAAHLGVRFDGNDYIIERRDLTRYVVYIHDDCYFWIEPLDEALLKQIIHCILRQHSFYLSVPVDWTGVLDPILQMLSQIETIRLKSDPSNRSLTVSWEPGPTTYLGRNFRRRDFREIRIDGSRAHFADANEDDRDPRNQSRG